MKKRYLVSMHEKVFYQFEVELEDPPTDEDELADMVDEAAHTKFVENGPVNEWISGCDDRNVVDFEEVA